MLRKLIAISTLVVFFASSCKNTEAPAPVKPVETTTINKTLLTGWWAPVEKNNARIYFGDDNFFYQDTITKTGEKNLTAPIAGFWSASAGVINYKQTATGTESKAFTVESLTATKLIIKNGNATINFTKLDRPAINSPAMITIAGNGIPGYSGDGGLAVNAALSNDVRGMAIDKAGNLYFCDYANNVIRKISTDGKISTVAGTGKPWESGIVYKSYVDGSKATTVDINNPLDVVLDADGNLYVTEDIENYGRINKITPDGNIYLVAGARDNRPKDTGDGGLAAKATLSEPAGLAFDKAGNLYVADIRNFAIRKIDAKTKIITRVAGTGKFEDLGKPIDNMPATSTGIQPLFIAIDADDNIYYTDITVVGLRKITASTGIISTLTNSAIKYNGTNADGGVISNLYAGYPWALCRGNNNDIFFANDHASIKRMDIKTSMVTTVAGNGYGGYVSDGPHATAYSLSFAYQVATDNAGNIYISQPGRIIKVLTK